MRPNPVPASILVGLSLLAACQVQHTTVVEQATSANLAANGVVPPPPRRPVAPLSPCNAPRGAGPFEHLAQPIAAPRQPLPQRALAERVSGCAGVKFRIAPNGTPQDIVLVTEYPVGYGFGDTAMTQVSGMRWAPKDDLAWRYMVVNLHAGG